MDQQARNRLDGEPSLYLRQHAENPVAWQPWDEEALEMARASGKPILLSIGYSACHWCHVMAHESFEDEATAKVMNELYVNIKVDREERPDLDKIYQLSHQLLTGRGGGWPLTLFLDSKDLTPFFAGTYFPLEPRYGMPAFREILVRARQWFEQNPDDVGAQSQRLKEAVESIQRPGGQAGVSATELLEAASSALLGRFDKQHGGYGGAPKFPQAPTLELAARIGRLNPESGAAVENTLLFTLEAMAARGLRDHLDGGFFRYCVDGDWTIPHFEKMLYDNAQLLPVYAEAASRSGRSSLATAAEGIVAWLDAEMLQENGAFSASIDADAAGEEGGFHVWTRDEVRALLDDAEYDAFSRAYGLEAAANFEGKAWHLVRSGHTAPESLLASSRAKLADARESREHPTLDSKQITSWNALTASGLLRAARALGRDDWAKQGQDALDFIFKHQWTGESLLSVHNAGESRFEGYLDDYAFTLEALLQSLQTAWRRRDLDFALQLADALLDRFEDADNGGFFFSAANQATPITRTLQAQDDATPSGYAVAVIALQQLASLVGNTDYLASANRALERASSEAARSPLGFPTTIRAAIEAEHATPQVIIRARDAAQGRSFKRWLDGHLNAHSYQILEAGGGKSLPGLLDQFHSEEPLTAWVCRGMTCLPPVHTKEQLEKALAN